MIRKQVLNPFYQCYESDLDQNYYNFLEGSDSQFLQIDYQFKQYQTNIESEEIYDLFPLITYEQLQQDSPAIENEEFEYESEEIENAFSHNYQIQFDHKWCLLTNKQPYEADGIYRNDYQEFECISTSQVIFRPQLLSINEQASQSYLLWSNDYINSQIYQCSNGLENSNESRLSSQSLKEVVFLEQTQRQRCGYYINELNEWYNQHKEEHQVFKCKKQIKYDKANAKLNGMISLQQDLSSENKNLIVDQNSNKNINQDKYKKIIKRLVQRDVKNIQQTIKFQNIIMEQLTTKLHFEKYDTLLNSLNDKQQSQVIIEKIIQRLYREFSEYQNQIIGLGQIESYVVLLIVKLAIYNYILDKKILQGEQFQNIIYDLLYFFISLNDEDLIMEQAKDYILNQQIFQLSSDIKQKITKKIMNQLCIDRQYYKSNQSDYCNYVKQSKQVIKNEEYMQFDEKKLKKKPVFFGKKNFLEIIKNDGGTIRDFAVNHHYSFLNENQGKIKRLSIYMDDIFNLLIQFEDLRKNNDII